MKYLMSVVFLSLFNLVTVSADNYLASEYYTIQIGTFSQPQAEHFTMFAGKGLLFLENRPNSNLKRVLLGKFVDKNRAAATLEEVKAIGFEDAFLQSHQVTTDEAKVYAIQVASYSASEGIDITGFQALGQLYLYATDNRIRVLVGQFSDLKLANQALQKVRDAGYETAFMKYLEPSWLELATDFEIAFLKLKSRTVFPKLTENATKGGTKEREIPKSYDKEIDTRTLFPAKTNTNSTKSPTSTGLTDVSRNSVERLQTTLIEANTYNGSVDGLYGENTRKGVESYLSENAYFQKYALMTREVPMEYSTKSLDMNSLQGSVELIENNPTLAATNLKRFSHPVAKAYLSYLYMSGLVPIENKVATVNQLMNEAIQKAFEGYTGKGRFDYKAKQTYTDKNKVLLHLAYLYEVNSGGTALPCWLVEEENDALTMAFAGLKPPSLASCEGFESWKEIRILKAMAQDFDPKSFNDKTKTEQAQLQASVAKRTELYRSPKPISADEVELYEIWNEYLWLRLDGELANDPIYGEMVTPFKVTYYLVFDKLENHFSLQGFDAEQAKGLALNTLYTLVNFHLGNYK